MSEKTLPNGFKNCVTCALWGGSRVAAPGKRVKFESNQKGKCHGGGFNNASMGPISTCQKWEIWPPIR